MTNGGHLIVSRNLEKQSPCRGPQVLSNLNFILLINNLQIEFISEHENGTMQITIYSPYWLVNHTYLPLTYKFADGEDQTHSSNRDVNLPSSSTISINLFLETDDTFVLICK